MNGVSSIIRYAITSDPDRPPFGDHPLILASVCQRYGWLEEYRTALERTLRLDVSEPEVYCELCTLEGVVVANIHRLRSLRIKRFKSLLSSKADTLEDFPRCCSSCTEERSDRFRQWKQLAVEEFSTYPSGHSLFLKEAFSSQPAVSALFRRINCDDTWGGFGRDDGLALAKFIWPELLRSVLDEVESVLASDLDVCLTTTLGPHPILSEGENSQRHPLDQDCSDEPLKGFHRQYLCTEEVGCVHLRSGDWTYCVHSALLCSASGFFRSTLSLPKCKGDTSDLDREEAIRFSEPSKVVNVLLDIISGRAFDFKMLPTVETALDILCAAEKYEMVGVTSPIRYTSLSHHSPFKNNPHKLALASHRYGWKHEYSIALARTLSLDIAPDHPVFYQLRSLDRPIFANMLKLRANRIGRFKELLTALVELEPKPEGDEISWDRGMEQSHEFREWKWLAATEFEEFPSGETLFEKNRANLPARLKNKNPRHTTLAYGKLLWKVLLKGVVDEVAKNLAVDLERCIVETEAGRRPIRTPDLSWSLNASDFVWDTGITPASDPKKHFHQEYSCISDVGCTHIKSSDDVLYCVHSAILKSASGFFRTTLPPSLRTGRNDDKLERPVPIQFAWPSKVVEILLGISCGRGLDVTSLPTVQNTMDILSAAVRYEMKGVISTIRCTILSELSPFKDKPLKMLLASHRYGWSSEYTKALHRTLSLDISFPDVYPSLCALEGAVFANLHKLRFMRTSLFSRWLLQSDYSHLSDDLEDVGNDPLFDSEDGSWCMKRRKEVFTRWKWLVVKEFSARPTVSHTSLLRRISTSSEVTALIKSCNCRHSDEEYNHNLEFANLAWTAKLKDFLNTINSMMGRDQSHQSLFSLV